MSLGAWILGVGAPSTQCTDVWLLLEIFFSTKGCEGLFRRDKGICKALSQCRMRGYNQGGFAIQGAMMPLVLKDLIAYLS